MSPQKEQLDRAVDKLLFKLKGLMTICRVFLQRQKTISAGPPIKKKADSKNEVSRPPRLKIQ